MNKQVGCQLNQIVLNDQINLMNHEYIKCREMKPNQNEVRWGDKEMRWGEMERERERERKKELERESQLESKYLTMVG